MRLTTIANRIAPVVRYQGIEKKSMRLIVCPTCFNIHLLASVSASRSIPQPPRTPNAPPAKTGDSPDTERAVSWSPDGSRLAVQSGATISVIMTDGSGQRVVATGYEIDGA